MKIGVNGRFLLKPETGIGRYTKHLFASIAAVSSDIELIIVTPAKTGTISEFEDFKNISIVELPEKPIPSAGLKKTYWEQVQVPSYLKKRKVDLIHFPYPSNPWYKFDIPVIVTVHDTIPWTEEEYRRSFLTRLYQDKCRNAVKNAGHIFCVSESSKKDVINVCGVESEKISVTYNAVSQNFLSKVPEQTKINILKKYGIDPAVPFLFYMGGYDKRKNVKFLVDTYMNYIAPYHMVNFVLGGGKILNDKLYGSFDYLTKTQKDTSLKLHKGNIVVTGFVDDSDLPALYQSSLAFLNLSKKEGFNLPLLEALVSGAPVITSDLPVHREVAGSVPVYCQPEDRDCLASHIRKMIEDPAYYQKQKQKAECFVNEFSWEKTAKNVVEIYKSFV